MLPDSPTPTPDPLAILARLFTSEQVAVLADLFTADPANYHDDLIVTALRLRGRQFWQSVQRRFTTNGTGCWMWPGARDGDGFAVVALPKYVRAGVGKERVRLHRIAWFATTGADRVPAGRMLWMTCGLGACFNPEHVGTAAVTR